METLKNAADQAETLRRMRSLSLDSPRQWGKMTVSQMLCHLADGFQMATGERPAEERSSLLTRTGLKWIFLYLPLPLPGELRLPGRDVSPFWVTRPSVVGEGPAPTLVADVTRALLLAGDYVDGSSVQDGTTLRCA